MHPLLEIFLYALVPTGMLALAILPVQICQARERQKEEQRFINLGNAYLKQAQHSKEEA